MDSVRLPENIETAPDGQRPAASDHQKEKELNNEGTTDIIPDEVPRKDGPGGEGSSK